jgi:lipopolysaccharide transport system permease protein
MMSLLAPAATGPSTITAIRPAVWYKIPLAELVQRRQLLGFLVWRDVKIRYRQTAIGVAWVLLQPLIAMGVFTLIFGRLAKLSPDGGSYFLFVYAALAPWLYFSSALTTSANSLIDSERLLTKVYFPRLYVPMSAAIAGLLDLLVSTGLLLVLQLAFGDGGLSVRVLTLPLWSALVLIWLVGLGAILASVNVRYRDVRYAMPFLVQVLLFASPIAYSSQIVPEAWRPAYAINPLVSGIDGFRWAVLGSRPLNGWAVVVSVVTALVALIGGMLIFNANERHFADVL